MRNASIKPATGSQKMFWTLHQLATGSAAHTLPLRVSIGGPLDKAAFLAAYRHTVASHPMLHAVFETGGDGVQARLTHVDPDVTVLDFTDKNDANESLGLRIRGMASHRFNLACGPLLKAWFIRMSPEKHEFLVCAHHIILDGWAFHLLFEKIGKAYQQLIKGVPLSPGSPLFISHEAKNAPNDPTYWQDLFRDVPPALDLPYDTIPPTPSREAGRFFSCIPEHLYEPLIRLNKETRTTLFAALSANLAILISKWSGQDDLTIGTISANRENPDEAAAIECLIRFLPLRFRIDDALGGRAWLSDVSRAVWDAHENRDSVPSHLPYRIGIMIQNMDLENVDFGPGLTIDARLERTDEALMDLRLLVAPPTNPYSHIALEWEYDKSLFQEETIRLLSEDYVRFLSYFVASPDGLLGSFAVGPQLQARRDRKTEHIVVASTFTAEPIRDALSFWAAQLGWKCETSFAPWGQLFQQFFESVGKALSNRNGINLFLIRPDDILAAESNETDVKFLLDALESYARRAKVPSLIILCPGLAADDDVRATLREACKRLNLHFIDGAEAGRFYGLHDIESPEVGGIPYKQEFYTALATHVMRFYRTLRHPPRKAIAVDCDGTLWRGIVSEDGIQGLQITPAHQALQTFLLEKKKKGMLLCLCSKNDEGDVFRVLEERPGMLLRRHDFAGASVNWDRKSLGLASLARQLDLGLDSFIFIDNLASECLEIALAHPEVVSVHMPDDLADPRAFLNHVWAFDTPDESPEDAIRTEFYLQNKERESFRAQTTSFHDFLRHLDVSLEMRPAGLGDADRIAQLSARTNQFNTSLTRYTSQEVERIIRSGGGIHIFNAKDRFGDYGIIGAVIHRMDHGTLVVDSFFLSCRALGKHIEYDALKLLCSRMNVPPEGGIRIAFKKSTRNGPALAFLESISKYADRSPQGQENLYFASFPLPDGPEPAFVESAFETAKDSFQTTGADSPPSARSARLIESIPHAFNSIEKIEKAIASQGRRRLKTGPSNMPADGMTETRIAGAVSAILKIDGIGRDDNLLQLGADSLKIALILSRLKLDFGVELDFQTLFQSPTVARLAVLVQTARAEVPAPLEIGEHTNDRLLPLSPNQQRIWFLNQLLPDVARYHLATSYRIKGKLDPEALRKAFSVLCHRHAILRMIISDNGNEMMQDLSGPVSVDLSPEDLSSFRPSQRLPAALQLSQDGADRAFDLTREAPIRTLLHRLDEDDHLLTVVLHHMAADGWSLGILIKELGVLYCEETGHTHATPAKNAPHTYTDFVHHQLQRKKSDAHREELSYWLGELEGAPLYLPLPGDFPRPSLPCFSGHVRCFDIPSSLVSMLREKSGAWGCTFFSILLSAFQIFLFQVSGQKTILVGCPVSNRHGRKWSDVVGYVANTVVMRADFPDGVTSRELVRKTADKIVQALDHQSLPFEDLVNALHPSRTLNHNPVFQVLFSYQAEPLPQLALGTLSVSHMDLDEKTSRFDLSLDVQAAGSVLEAKMEYNTGLFKDETAALFEKNYLSALHDLLTFSDRPLLSRIPPKSDRFVPDLFEQWVRTQPDAPALIGLYEDDDRIATLSYQELNGKANALAQRLASEGVSHGNLIGLSFDRSLDLVISMLAVLKTGAAYVPLDPGYPEARLKDILSEAHLDKIITHPRHQVLFRSFRLPLTTFSGLQSESSKERPSREPRNDGLCYVIFTSGSSGRPKGVEITHANLASLIENTRDLLGLGPKDIWSLFHSSSFDFSVWEIWGALLNGGCLAAVPTATARHPEDFHRFLSVHGVTVLNQTPSALTALVESFPETPPDRLRILISGGEPLPGNLAAKASRWKIPLWNFYGPTETTVWCACHRVTEDDAQSSCVTIGKALPGYTVHLLDENGEPAKMGSEGGIHVTGAGVAKGYHRRPDLTAQAFGFLRMGDATARSYRTGDRGCLLPDGGIAFLGRADRQIKIRGHRIELGEIEYKLGLHPDVAKVVCTTDREGIEKMIVAHVVARKNANLHPTDLKKYLRDALPDYMVPSSFLILDRMPLSPNGKIDYKALGSVDYREKEATPPANVLEGDIIKIWKQVLLTDRIGRDDNFFDLGGNSLLLTKVNRLLRDEMREDIPVIDLFQFPTVSSLAKRLKRDNLPPTPSDRGRQRRERLLGRTPS